MTAPKHLLTFFSLVGFVVLSSSVAMAKPGFDKGGEGHHGPDFQAYAAELGIDDSTLAEIKTLRRAARDESLDIRFQLKKARNVLHDLLDADHPDERQIMQQAEELGRIKTEMRKVRLRTMLKIHALLSPEQRTRFKQIRREKRRDGKRGDSGCKHGKQGKHGKHGGF